MVRLEVNIPGRSLSYPIHIGWDSLGELGQVMSGMGVSRRILVVSDTAVLSLYRAAVERSLAASGFDPGWAVFPPGEETKTLASASRLWDLALENRLDRKSAVLALGGGVVGDLAGFAAAAFMRGVPFVQVPTTLLAQVDSSVGGKVAVDHPLGKNLIGAFHQPLFVLADLSTLRTLPPREVGAGMAEVIKYGLIADAGFFSFLETRAGDLRALEPEALVHVVAACCRLKAEVVAADERDTADVRAILNCGHTIGHAVEAATSYGAFRHGEAVALGMIVEGRIAVADGLWDRSGLDRLQALLESFNLPVSGKGIPADRILAHLPYDKKAVGGKTRFVLPAGIGSVKLSGDVTPEQIAAALRATGFEE
ncbi:MAG: 3-dehydroquinate synthase [Firmicutes bacterium]|nr:3-dehydroquinate synthase [Bacillota bacterium]